MEPVNSKHRALEAIRQRELRNKALSRLDEEVARNRESAGEFFTNAKNMWLGGVGRTAGMIISGIGSAGRTGLPGQSILGGHIVRAGRRVSEYADETFPMSETAQRGGQAVGEDLQKQGEDKSAFLNRPASEGASFNQRKTRELIQGLTKGAIALGHVMKNDPEAGIAYLTDTTVRNAPSSALAIGAYYVAPGASFASSFLLETGALAQELDAVNEAEGTSPTLKQEMAILIGGGTAAALDLVGSKAVFGAATRVAAGKAIPAGSKNMFLKGIKNKLAPFALAGREMTTEMAQEIIANQAAIVGWDPDRELTQGAWESGIAAGPTTFVAGLYGNRASTDQATALPTPGIRAIEALDLPEVQDAMIEDPMGTMAMINEPKAEYNNDPNAPIDPDQTPWTDEEARSLDKHIRGGGPITLEEASRHPRTLRAFLAGSPPQVTNAADQVAIENRLRGLAEFGVVGRYWYENSGNAILGVTRNMEDAIKLTKLIAITSPQNPVPENHDDALQIWSEYQESLRTGQRVEFTGGKQGSINKRAAELLYDNKDWSGLKTNAFYNNIMAVFQDSPGNDVTIDLWQMRALGYESEAPTPAQYRYGTRTTNNTASAMGWKGRQVQAASWTAVKHLREQKNVEDLVGVDLTQYDPTEVETVDYSTVANWRRAQISVEVIPGRSTGMMPGIHEAPIEQRQEYTEALWGALHDKGGNNILFDHFGVLAEDKPNILSGYWQGDTNPVMQIQVQAVKAQGASEAKGVRVTPTLYVPGLRGTDRTILSEEYGDARSKEGKQAISNAFNEYLESGSTGNAEVDAVFEDKIRKQDVFTIQPEQQRAIRGLAAALGLLFKQEGIGYHRPIYNADKKQENGAEFAFESKRTVTPDEMKAIAGRIDEDHGMGASDRVALISTTEGFRVLNFGLMVDNVKFQSYIDEAVISVTDEATTQGRFAAFGDLIENNWEENPNGEEYTAGEFTTGSPNFQGRILGTVSRQIAEVNRSFADRYGWDEVSRFDRDAQTAAGIESENRTVREKKSLYQNIDGSPANLKAAESNRELSKKRAQLHKDVDGLAREGVRETQRESSYVKSRQPPRGTVLARAISGYLKRYKTSAIVGLVARSAQDLAHLMQIYRSPDWETMRYIYTRDGEIVHHDAMSIRMPGVSTIFPKSYRGKNWVEFVNDRMNKVGADKVYFAHNHPSGNPRPSTPDTYMTAQGAHQLGSSFGGHIVIDSGKASIIDGSIVQRLADGRTTRAVKDTDFTSMDVEVGLPENYIPDVDNPILGSRVTSPDDLSKVAIKLREQGARIGNGSVLLVATTGPGAVAGVLQIEQSELKGARGKALVRATMRSMGSSSVFALGVDSSHPDTADHMIDMMKSGFLRDVLSPYGQSMADHYGIDDKLRQDPVDLDAGAAFVSEDDSQYAPGGRARPDLALPGNEEAQGAINEADAVRNKAGEPAPQTNEAQAAEADRLLKEDYHAQKDRVFNTPGIMESDPVAVKMAQKILSIEARAAANSGDTKAWGESVLMGIKYRAAGTETARSLQARGSSFSEAPVDFIMQAITKPTAKAEAAVRRELGTKDEALESGVGFAERKVAERQGSVDKVQQKLDDLNERAKKEDVAREIASVKAELDAKRREVLNAKNRLETRNRQLKDAQAKRQKVIDDILNKEAEAASILHTKLKDLGIDVGELTVDNLTREQAANVLRNIQTHQATGGDMLYEFWVNALLSGPVTHVKNFISNTFSIGWDISVQRWTETAIASSIRLGEAAAGNDQSLKTKNMPYIGEMKYIYGALLNPQVWKRAMNRGALAFNTEQPSFTNEILGSGTKLEGTLLRASIPGTTGRVIRAFGTRTLLFGDEVAKSFIYDMHVGAFAHRIAKDEGLSGQDMQDRMTELMNDPSSKAVQQTIDLALELPFQTQLGAIGQDVQTAAGLFGVRWVLPFVKTPGNILKQGTRKSLLGSISLAVRIASGKLEGRALKLASEQLIAWVSLASIAGLALSTDDEDRPYLTGSRDKSSPGAREAEARGIPYQSVLIGGKYRSYRGIEPLSTMLAITVDAINLWQDSKRGIDADRALEAAYSLSVGIALDKSWTASVSDVIKMTESGEGVLEWSTKFGSSFMPNIVRLAGKATDPYWRDTKVKGDGGAWMADFTRKTGYRALPFKDTPLNLLPQPAVDVWGDEAKKWTTGRLSTDIAFRMLSPVDVREVHLFEGDRFLVNYNNAFPNETWWPAVPGASFSRDGISYSLNDDQYHELLTERGQRAKFIVGEMIKTPGGIDPDNPTIAQAQMMRKAFETAGGVASKIIFAKYFAAGHEAKLLEKVDKRFAPARN